MATRAEQILENNLVAQLETLGYKKIVVCIESDLLANFIGMIKVRTKLIERASTAKRITERIMSFVETLKT